MEEAMALEIGSGPIQLGNGEEMEVSPDMAAAEGMSFSQQYMAGNGPIRPLHIGQAKTMTKRQLEEQKMNEAQGYPSNLDEAEKVKELESKVTEMSQGISAILSHLQGNPPTAPQNSPSPSEGMLFPASTVSPARPRKLGGDSHDANDGKAEAIADRLARIERAKSNIEGWPDDHSPETEPRSSKRIGHPGTAGGPSDRQ